MPGQVLALEHVRSGPEVHAAVSHFVVVSAGPNGVARRLEVGGYTAEGWTAIAPDGGSVAYWRSMSQVLTPPFELVLWDPVGRSSAVIHREDALRPLSLVWSSRGDEVAFVLSGPADPVPPADAGAAADRLFVMEPRTASPRREVRRSDGLAPGGLLSYDGDRLGMVRAASAPGGGLVYESVEVPSGSVAASAPIEVSPEAVSRTGHMAGLDRPFERPSNWMKVWEPARGDEIASVEIVGVDRPVFRPDSADLVFSVSGSELRVVDIGTRAVRSVFTSTGVGAVAFDPTGTYLLVTADRPRYAILRAGATYETVAEISVPIRAVTPLGWLSSGSVSMPPPARPIARDLPEDQAEAEVGPRASEVVVALRDRDMAVLSAMAHPTKGIRFSPYAYADPRGDQRLTAEELRRALADPATRTWGSYDGIGGPIDLAFAQYFARFVYDRDFAAAPEIAYNRAIGSGNTIDNSAEMYPDAIMVEYHFPSSQDTLDWKSLRLLFEELDGAWYLVAIIHAEWTI